LSKTHENLPAYIGNLGRRTREGEEFYEMDKSLI